MGRGWRRAFCNTMPRDRRDQSSATTPSLTVMDNKQSSRSNPSTPRLRCNTFPNTHDHNNNNKFSINNSVRSSPKLQCKTTTPPKSLLRCNSSSSSPRSPFSILKNTLRFSKNNCGVCMRSVKTGQAMAMYTAECSHTFHFPCIASHVTTKQQQQNNLILCPVCTTTWKHIPFLNQNQDNPLKQQQDEEKIVVIDSSSTPKKQTPISSPKCLKQWESKSYADDEPLMTPKAGAKFIPIPEAAVENEEEEEVEEFQGFLVDPISSSDALSRDPRKVDVSLLPEAAVISTGGTHETYAVVLKVKAPLSGDMPRRAPIDLVTVLDVSGSMSGAKLQMLQRAMRLVISSLGSADRLSIVAFSALPKRILPLTRMGAQGQRLARRIIDRLACSRGTSMAEALKQATKVLEDRRDRNPVASIILLSGGGQDDDDDRVPKDNNESNQRPGSSHVSSTRFSHVEIPRDPAEDAFSKCVGGLLSVVIQDLRIQLSFGPGSDPAEISAVYSFNQRPTVHNPAFSRLGDLYAEEERELLVEIRVPRSVVAGSHSHHVFSIKCCYKDPATQELVYGRDQALLLPRPQTVHSRLLPNNKIERLRNSFITTRAIAESRRLIEHAELSSAMQLLSSARALLLLQSRSESASGCIRGLDAELAEVERRTRYQRRRSEEREMGLYLDEKEEPLTPTSAEKLASVVQMESLNTVSDLHGFENARF
ncbi:hypothetical protein BUALT_Bualt08G0030600 [Buddleja alternifolia]|uniref:Uncharacterized protein n=1 Tax=Buddleja alternifolia TaxID=168488 RepID=A0AAV6XE45_9LAMI|nr:hypothetical protein BUALT_Bualt08G0030600 [Buddleja alternifolia]